MALSDVGVLFVSRGFDTFMRNMSSAVQAITKMGSMTQNRLKALDSANAAMAKMSQKARDIAVSEDKLRISQQQTIQSTNALKKAQEQTKIAQERTAQSVNNSKTAYYNMQRGVAASAAELKKMDYNIVRLGSIERLNDALLQGTITLEQYTTAALATNNQLRMLGSTASSTSGSMSSLVQEIGGALGGLGGIFGNVSSWGNMGAAIGVALGSVIPILGNGVGAIAGYLMGALGGIGAGITKWFIGLAASIGRSILNLGKQIIGWIGSIFNNILSTLKGLLGSVFNLLTFGIFKSGWNNLGNTIVSSMFKFEILKKVIRSVTSEISNMASSAFKAAQDLQVYTARLTFLINSQIRMTDSTIDETKAMNMAIAEAEQLLRWEQKLALTSPVSIEDVHTTLSMGIAMGWTVKSAQELTTSILNYTSATGLSSDISERIIYNFAQMRNAGKVTGTELRDLARGAFINVNKVLEIMYTDLQNGADGQKKFTGTFQEFREAAVAGKVDVEGFFTAFNKYVGEYMPNAMEKMNYTIVAVKDNIRDLFKTLLGWNVVGPIVTQFTAPLKKLVDMLSTDKVILGAQRIGQGISLLVKGMKTGISAIVKSIGDLLKASGFALPTVRNIVMSLVKFGMAFAEIGKSIASLITKLFTPLASKINNRYGQTFEAMRGNFFKWGANLILSLAKGMMQAASKALVAVMRGITRLLASWLVGHSPPKVAPDIDKWGAETITEYYKGFAEPDTAAVNTAMNNVSSTIQGIMSSASATIANAATGTVSAPNIDFGTISGWLHTFSQADFDALDSVQASLQDVLGVMVDLGQLSDEQSGQLFVDISTNLMQALSDFNETGQISTSIFDQLRNLGGALGTELAELLDMQLQLAVAVEQTAAAQKAYDDAVKASAKANVKVNKMVRDYNDLLRKGASKGILKNQLKIVNASEDEYATAKKVEHQRKTELDLAEERQKALEESVKLQEQILKQMTELVNAQKDAADGAGGIADEIASELEGLGDIDLGFDVTPPWTDEDLKSWIAQAQAEFETEWENIKKGWTDTWKSSFGQNSEFYHQLSLLKSAWGAFTGELGTIWDAFASAVHLPDWETLTAGWGTPMQKKVVSYNPLDTNIPEEAIYNPKSGNYEITTYSNTLLDKIKETLGMLADSIKNGEGGVNGFLQRVANYILDGIANFLGVMASDPGIQSKISGAINSVLDFISGVISSNPLENNPGSRVELEYGIGDQSSLSKIAASLLKLLTDSVTTAVSTLVSNGTLLTVGQQIGEGILEGIKASVPKYTFNELIGIWFGEGAKNIADWLTGNGTAPLEVIPTIPPLDLGDILHLPDALDNWLHGTPPKLPTINYKDDVEDTGKSISEGINTAATDQMALENFTSLKDKTIERLNSAYQASSPAKAIYPVGENLADGIAEGMLKQFGLIMWGTKLQPLIDQVKTFFLISGEGPSTKFVTIGTQMTIGMTKGILDKINSTNWSSVLQPLIDKVKTFFGISGTGPSGKFSSIGNSLANGLASGLAWSINVAVIQGGSIYNAIAKIVSSIRSQLSLDNISKSPFYKIGTDMVWGIINGFEAMIPTLIARWNALVNRLPADMRDKYKMTSPSKLFMEMGEDIISGLALGLRGMERTIDSHTTSSVDRLAPSISVPATMQAPPVYGGTTVSFGDTYINNGMDWAMFKAQVHRAIVER